MLTLSHNYPTTKFINPHKKSKEKVIRPRNQEFPIQDFPKNS